MAEADVAPGIEIGGCKVLGKLGAGAMGTVYKAHHLALDKVVALKVLNASWNADGTFVDRFQREARAAAKLEHPNVVQVYNVGHERGAYFIVMQYVEGESLQDLVEREGKLALTPATRIIRGIATALVEAHAKSIVHRDIKTANILIGKDSKPRLTDFGLARSIEAHKGLTVPGTIMGTPGYIAPEVIEGKPADFRADQYALGVAYYYLLSGTLPHQGKTAYEVFSRQLTDRPAPLATIAPDVPAPIAQIVHRMMSRNPDERFPSVAAFVEALDAAWQGLSNAAPAALQAAPAPASVQAARKPQAWDERVRQIERKDRKQRIIGNAVGWIFMLLAFALAAVLAGSAVDAVESRSAVTLATPFTEPFRLQDPRWLPHAGTVLLACVSFACFYLFGRRQLSRSASPLLAFVCAAGALAAFYVQAFLTSLPLVSEESLTERWPRLWSELFSGFWTPVNEIVLGAAAWVGALVLLGRAGRRMLTLPAAAILALASFAAVYRFALGAVRSCYPETGASWRVPVDTFYSVLLGVFVAGVGIAVAGPLLRPRSAMARLGSVAFFALAAASLYAFGALGASPAAVFELGWSGVLALPLEGLPDRLMEQRGYLGLSVAGLVWGSILFYLRPAWDRVS